MPLESQGKLNGPNQNYSFEELEGHLATAGYAQTQPPRDPETQESTDELQQGWQAESGRIGAQLAQPDPEHRSTPPRWDRCHPPKGQGNGLHFPPLPCAVSRHQRALPAAPGSDAFLVAQPRGAEQRPTLRRTSLAGSGFVPRMQDPRWPPALRAAWASPGGQAVCKQRGKRWGKRILSFAKSSL